ncbi:MAG: DPP IV N-terminal domain-containing protein [Bacteroidota bacterium]|nr:DPP IV N-terminal domain-containing protein [Bacteroidota bacterium]
MRIKGRTYFQSFLLIGILVCVVASGSGQFHKALVWSADGNGFYHEEDGGISKTSLPAGNEEPLLNASDLTPAGKEAALEIRYFVFSSDFNKLLVYTNARKVWRYETRGDYWVYDFSNHSLKQLGSSLPSSSLMFAKFSPDGKKAAYVSGHNLYVEDLGTHKIKALTRDGTRKLINGTFDWVYEEEFDCRDGFRWSPDSKAIAFWQIEDSGTRDYLMLNTTDSVYSHVVPVEYPVAGQLPSPYKVGVVNIAEDHIRWMHIPTDARLGSYLPRMEWADNSQELIVQHLNRQQNQSDVLLCRVRDGSSKKILAEKDSAWIDIISRWDDDYRMGGWDWLQQGSEFIWPSEKDGWRHLYRVSRDGKKQTLITPGNYDVMNISLINEKENLLYFMASPENATQKYLYRCNLDGKGKAERVTPANEQGTHGYDLSPNGQYAFHSFSNYYTPNSGEWISLPFHRTLPGTVGIKTPRVSDSLASPISFFKIKTADGVTMDAWMKKPVPFDPSKKYPVLFEVYTEPGSQTVLDYYGIGGNPLYQGDLSKDGYIYISVDNRGTPAPKGADWRNSIYRKIGRLNIHDQAMAAREIMKWPFVDSSRIAVWGWSGGGSATLNLMFQYPDIYKTGIAVAALCNLLTYDNIYEERYMGIPQEAYDGYVKGSPISYARNLQGNLLYIHGTGDDNVHFNNAEMLVNELIKYNKNFQYMPYPNRTHAINEGPGTREHLQGLYTRYLREHCPGGPK